VLGVRVGSLRVLLCLFCCVDGGGGEARSEVRMVMVPRQRKEYIFTLNKTTARGSRSHLTQPPTTTKVDSRMLPG